MVHRPSDSRLLTSLISHEKDLLKSLSTLLSTSHASYTSLTAYAASSPPPSSQVILAVAGTLLHADEALKAYARGVEEWKARLEGLKEKEEEVGNVVRDREILVTRVLKASVKSVKQHQQHSSKEKDEGLGSMSVMAPASTSSTLSLSSLGSNNAVVPLYGSTGGSGTGSNNKLQAAQAELQACEAHLAIKEAELERLRVGAVTDGLRIRFRALAECGARWVEVGKEVEVVLGVSDHTRTTSSPRPSSEISHTTMSSIAPSQSASQVGIVHSNPSMHLNSLQLHTATTPTTTTSVSGTDATVTPGADHHFHSHSHSHPNPTFQLGQHDLDMPILSVPVTAPPATTTTSTGSGGSTGLLSPLAPGSPNLTIPMTLPLPSSSSSPSGLSVHSGLQPVSGSGFGSGTIGREVRIQRNESGSGSGSGRMSRHVLPHRITEESLRALGVEEQQQQQRELDEEEEEEEEEEGGSSVEEGEGRGGLGGLGGVRGGRGGGGGGGGDRVRVVENPKFASSKGKSKSVLASASDSKGVGSGTGTGNGNTGNGRPRAKSESVTSFSPSMSASGSGGGSGHSGSGSGFFGSLRGLFGAGRRREKDRGREREKDKDREREGDTGSMLSGSSQLSGLFGQMGHGKEGSSETSQVSQGSSLREEREEKSRKRLSGIGIGKGKGKKKWETRLERNLKGLREEEEEGGGSESENEQVGDGEDDEATLRGRRGGTRTRVMSDVGYSVRTKDDEDVTPRASFSGSVTPTQQDLTGRMGNVRTKRLKKRSLRGKVVEREWERAATGTDLSTDNATGAVRPRLGSVPGIKATSSDLGIPTTNAAAMFDVAIPRAGDGGAPSSPTIPVSTSNTATADPIGSGTETLRGRQPSSLRQTATRQARPLSRGNDLVDEQVERDLEMKARRRSLSVDHLEKLGLEEEGEGGEDVVDLGVWDRDDTERQDGEEEGKVIEKKKGKGKKTGHRRASSVGVAETSGTGGLGSVVPASKSTSHLPASTSSATPVVLSSASATNLTRSNSAKSSKSSKGTKSTKGKSVTRRSVLMPPDSGVKTMLPTGAPSSASGSPTTPTTSTGKPVVPVKDTPPAAPVPAPPPKDRFVTGTGMLSPLGSEVGTTLHSSFGGVGALHHHHDGGLESRTQGGLVGVPVLSSSGLGSGSGSTSTTSLPISTTTKGKTKREKRTSAPPGSVVVAPNSELNGNTGAGAGVNASGGTGTSLMSIVEGVAKTNREAWAARQSGSGKGMGMVGSVGGTMKPVGLVDPLPNSASTTSSSFSVGNNGSNSNLNARMYSRGAGAGTEAGVGVGGLEIVKAPPSISIEELEGMDLGSFGASGGVGDGAHEESEREGRVGRKKSVRRSGSTSSRTRSRSRSRSRIGEKEKVEDRVLVHVESGKTGAREEFVQGSSGSQRSHHASSAPSTLSSQPQAVGASSQAQIQPQSQVQQVQHHERRASGSSSPSPSSSSPVTAATKPTVTTAAAAAAPPTTQRNQSSSLSSAPATTQAQVLPPLSPMGTGLSTASASAPAPTVHNNHVSASSPRSSSPSLSPHVTPNSSSGPSNHVINALKQHSRPAQSPLKSALKNPSRTPSPMVLGSEGVSGPGSVPISVVAAAAVPVQQRQQQQPVQTKQAEEKKSEPEPEVEAAPKVIAPVPVVATSSVVAPSPLYPPPVIPSPVIPSPVLEESELETETDTDTEAEMTPVMGQVGLPPVSSSSTATVMGNGDARLLVIGGDGVGKGNGGYEDDDGGDSDGSGSSDGASISSYETGHEMFDFEEDGEAADSGVVGLDEDVRREEAVNLARIEEEEQEEDTETEGEEERTQTIPSATYAPDHTGQTQVQTQMQTQTPQIQAQAEKERKERERGYFDVRRPGVVPSGAQEQGQVQVQQQHTGLNGDAQRQGGSDVSSPSSGSGGTATPVAGNVGLPNSSSVNSTQVQDQAQSAAANAASTAGTTPVTSGTSTPQRRKSVRVSLRPTFSATPPAIEYSSSEEEMSVSHQSSEDHEHQDNSSRTGRGSTENQEKGEGGQKDMWADSSEEDEEYSRAKRLLGRVMRKGKGKGKK